MFPEKFQDISKRVKTLTSVTLIIGVVNSIPIRVNNLK